MLARGTDRVQDAKQSYEEAISLFEVLVRDQPENVKYRLGLARASYNLGSLYVINLNNIRESKKYLEQARAIYQELVDEHPSVGEYRADLAKTFGQIGSVFRFQVPPDETLVSFERARELLEGLVRDHPTITRYRGDLALSEYNIGDRQLAAKRMTQALISFDKALKLCKPLLTEAPKNAVLKRQMAAVLTGRGTALAALKRLPESAQAFERAISVGRESYDAPASTLFRQEVSWEMVYAHEELVKVWRALGRAGKGHAGDLFGHRGDRERFRRLGRGIWISSRAFTQRQAARSVREKSSLSVADAAKREAYAARAVDLLRRSMEAGYGVPIN